MKKNKSKTNRLLEDSGPQEPVLRCSPTAWAKLLYLRDLGDTEIAGFGIAPADDLLYVEEFLTVGQEVTMASFRLDDSAVADFFDCQVDAGRKPEQFARILVHSHPGNSALPSETDEENFQKVFGPCQWAAMLIIAQNGTTYARLRFNVGPGADVSIPVQIDYSRPFGTSDQQAWEAEYQANIKTTPWVMPSGTDKDNGLHTTQMDLVEYSVPTDWVEEFEAMEPAERQYLLDELAGRPDLWEESGVAHGF